MSADIGFTQVSFPNLVSTPGLAEAEARSRGHASGYAAGMRAAEQSIGDLKARYAAEQAALIEEHRIRHSALETAMGTAIAALNARTAPVVAEIHSALAGASVEVAEAIIGVELSHAETSARAAVTRALSDIDTALVVAVRMHPDTLAALDGTARVEGVNFVPDASLTPGDAVADFADGYLDARLATAVARVRAALGDGPA